jgi:glucosamine-6-phosphate deaminase
MEVLYYPEASFEKLAVTHMADAREGALGIAKEIAELIRAKQPNGKRTLLGLATGSSPIGVDQELVRLYREESLRFQNAGIFNLAEYYQPEYEVRYAVPIWLDPSTTPCPTAVRGPS